MTRRPVVTKKFYICSTAIGELLCNSYANKERRKQNVVGFQKFLCQVVERGDLRMMV